MCTDNRHELDALAMATSQDVTKVRAEALKAEGNALHLARKYKQAYAKYSEAIEVDDKNAILYANRAASSLEMEE